MFVNVDTEAEPLESILGQLPAIIAESGLDPSLDAIIGVPDDAFAQRIDQPDDSGGGRHLRPELCALGDTARNDGRDGRGERG